MRLVFFIDLLFIQTGTDPYPWPPFPSYLPHFLMLQVPRYQSTTVVLSVAGAAFEGGRWGDRPRPRS